MVAAPSRLARTEARKLQLSAERGGGVGLLLRQTDEANPGLRTGGGARRAPSDHAAATRWLVRPVPGERTVQRWQLQLIYGHGGRVGQSVILEHRRDSNTLDAHPAATVSVPVLTADDGAGAASHTPQAHPVRAAAPLADRPSEARPAKPPAGTRATA